MGAIATFSIGLVIILGLLFLAARAGWLGIVLGTGLALVIAALTLFNDAVLEQPLMTGDIMPTGVYGILIVLGAIFGGHFILRQWGGRVLSKRDMVWIVVLSTAACSWPGWSYFHPFVPMTGTVGTQLQSRIGWQGREVLSYIPGGSPRLAEGYLRGGMDLWARLAEKKQEADGEKADHWLVREVRGQFLGTDAYALQDAQPPATESQARKRERILLRALNRVIDLSDLGALAPAQVRAQLPTELQDLSPPTLRKTGKSVENAIRDRNRALMTIVWPAHVLPKPVGEGVLLMGGQPTPGVTDVLATGQTGHQGPWWSLTPWRAWWPVMRLWMGTALMIALATLCLTLIVHPQWSKAEQLPYPLVKLVGEIVQPAGMSAGADGDKTSVFRSRLFWMGAGLVLGIHLINGMRAWFPGFILHVPLQFSFTPLTGAWPMLYRGTEWWTVLQPHIYFSALAMAYFVRTDVSFSVGISQFVWMALGMILYKHGMYISNTPTEPNIGPYLRAGAYLGYTLIILYYGRRYYLSIGMQAVGLQGMLAQNRAAVWGARMLPLFVGLGAGLLARYGGMTWWLALMLILIVLMMLLVMARLTAETGLTYVQANFVPISLLGTLFGLEGLGPTVFVMVTMSSFVLIGDTREPIMAYLVNGMNMAEKIGGIRPGKAAWGQGAIVIAALVVAAAVTLTLCYSQGIGVLDPWAGHMLNDAVYRRFTGELNQASALGTLADSVTNQGLDHFTKMNPDWPGLGVIGVGLALVLVCTVAAIRIPRWPIHPTMFVVMGSVAMTRMAWTFFLGWMIKSLVLRMGGVRMYHAGVPLMLGLIAGELLAALSWQSVGFAYYLSTGLQPKSYFILPW